MILQEMRSKDTSKRVPNAGIIRDLIAAVEDHPDAWLHTVDKVNDIGGYKATWDIAKSKIDSAMQAPHRSTYRDWLEFQLKSARTKLIDSAVKNGYETLVLACEALLVYDAVTPPRHGPRSDVVMNMKPDEVKYRATRVPVHGTNGDKKMGEPEEATPLLLAARVFLSAVEDDNPSDDLDTDDLQNSLDDKPLEPVQYDQPELTPDVKKLAEEFKKQFQK